MTTVTHKEFGQVDNTQNYLYTLSNKDTEISIMNYGATIVSIKTKDKKGDIYDVVCGYDSVLDYQTRDGYLGAVIGRNSNRIANSKFTLNGKEYKLYTNDKSNNLHGGLKGFDKKMWEIKEIENGIECTLISEDMEEGYPGKVSVCVKYTLSDDNALSIEYTAVSDKDTIVNLTNHSYFNLNGHNSGTIENHKIKINSNFYTPLDENCAVIGEVLSVDNTMYDFRNYKVIGDDIDNIPDFDITGGYDHNYILDVKDKEMVLASSVIGDKTNIEMEVHTNKPSMQFYAGNFIEKCIAKDNASYDKRQGLCLETQFTPNCQNLRHLGNPVLKANEIYNYKTIYKFLAK